MYECKPLMPGRKGPVGQVGAQVNSPRRVIQRTQHPRLLSQMTSHDVASAAHLYVGQTS